MNLMTRASLALIGSVFFAGPLSALPAILTPIQNVSLEIGKAGGVKTMTTVALPKTFNVYLAAETSSTDVLEQMYLGLIKTNPQTTAIEPSLAESWTISSDQRTYTFKLRQGLKWSDGKPLTADDVVFTYNEIINNDSIPNNYRAGLMIETAGEAVFPTIKKGDARTVVITTPRPFSPFLRGLSDPIMPKHIFADKTQPDEEGEVAFNQLWDLSSAPDKIVVNGPWKLGKFVPGERIELVRNPHYHLKDAKGQPLPYLDKLIMLEVVDQAAEVDLFNNGISDALALNAYDLPRISRKDAKVYNLGPATGTLFVMFNQSTAFNEEGQPVVDPIKSAWFRNKLFRQALAHAMDKQSMIKDIYNGLAQPQFSHISQTSPFYNPNIRSYAYDLSKAQSLLNQAGFKKNAKGELLDPKGHRVAFKLVTNTGNELRNRSCQILKRDWAKLGIQVSFVSEPFNVMVEALDQTLAWEVMLIGLTGSAIEPHFGISTWKLDGRMHMFNMGHPDYWSGTKGTSYLPWEKEVLALYEQAAKEFDLEKRKLLYQKSQAVVAENVPFLFTVNPFFLVVMTDRLGNVFPNLNGGTALNTVNWNTDQQFVKH